MPSDITLATVASLLRRGKSLDVLSGYLTAVGLAWGLIQWPLGAGSLVGGLLAVILVLAGLAQKYWALRVAFDADLFSHLAERAADLPARTADLDQALIALGLLPATRAGRPWPQRCRGALSLLRTQATVVAFQAALALGSLFSMPWLYPSALM